uniref:Uncharacterized protein n=1 Tax=Myoviridae sp. ctnhb8 TaxID=2825171 RepID=A0A8S5VE75_9CAUD|nr:MAG TPA: hypothetical protein [Myoviridae sp. ctnhb8]
MLCGTARYRLKVSPGLCLVPHRQNAGPAPHLLLYVPYVPALLQCCQQAV